MHDISMNVVEVIIGKIYFQINFGIYVTSHFGCTGISNNGLNALCMLHIFTYGTLSIVVKESNRAPVINNWKRP